MSDNTGRFKLMKDRTDLELVQTIENAEQVGKTIGDHLGLGGNPFWDICAGVDAYFEKRRRKIGPKKE